MQVPRFIEAFLSRVDSPSKQNAATDLGDFLVSWCLVKCECYPSALDPWDRTHLACTSETSCTQDACGPRDPRPEVALQLQIFIRSGKPQNHGNLVHDFINTVTDFPLGGFLGVLCVLEVNADTQF